MARHDGRQPADLRPFKLTPNFQKNPEGSCLVEMGNTRVLCSAMVEDSVPPFLRGSGSGWVTAEYSMLPGSSSQRIQRDRKKVSGRTQEIQRLIGRSLRSCFDLSKMGEVSFLIDCDVIDADGGTRTASITGAYVALMLAVDKVKGKYPAIMDAKTHAVAAVSVGMVSGAPVLDLDYPEDKDAEVDMNLVMTSKGKFIEIQGTGENADFDREQLNSLIDLGAKGIGELLDFQKNALGQ